MAIDKRRAISQSTEQAYAIEHLHEHWILPGTRDIWIHGAWERCDLEIDEPGVEFMMATKVIKNLHYLRYKNPDKPVTIHLQSNGGYWEQGMAIYDTIKSMPYHVNIVCYTHARSMSSLIFLAGDTRLMMPHSYFMLHRGTLCLVGEHQTVMSNTKWSEHCDEQMMNIYVENAIKGPKFADMSESRVRNEIKRRMEKAGDVFLTPKEAIDWGFADGVFDQDWPNNGEFLE